MAAVRPRAGCCLACFCRLGLGCWEYRDDLGLCPPVPFSVYLDHLLRYLLWNSGIFISLPYSRPLLTSPPGRKIR